jgi:NADH dehydrogenase
MTVLVTGGSGFVGREIVRQLQAAGHNVRVLVRGTRRSTPTVRTVHGSVLRPSTLASACAGCDAVIHLVGIISEIAEQTYENVHTEGTCNVISAAKATGITRLVHMSALGTRPDAVARYHRSKWAAEDAVRASGLAWTIFRPSLVYGSGDGFVNLFARMSRWSPMLPVIGDGTNLLQPIAVEDVAHCFVGALAKLIAVGQTYDLCGLERFRFSEVLDEILAATGRRRWKSHIPMPLARTQASLLESIFPRVFRRAPPLNRDQLRMLAEDNVGDPSAACRAFCFEPMKFREGIRRFLS